MQRPRTTYKFSPELAALLEALLRQGHVVRSDATARVSSGQTTQQVRRKKEIEDTVPKTRAEGRKRAAEKAWERREQRRKSGKTIDLESSERAIAEATKPTGYTKLADFFHQLGEAAMTDALIMSGIVNPVRTAFSVVGGALGGNAVDKKMLNLTKSDEKPEGQTWSEWVNDKLGLRQGHMVGQFSNPGILLGGAVGYKTPGAIDYLVRADLARFGFTPTTLYFFRPNYLGMNGSAVGKVETSPSEAVRKAYTAPNLERLEMTTAEPLMSASKGAIRYESKPITVSSGFKPYTNVLEVVPVNFNPNLVVATRFGTTLGDIHKFWTLYGNLSEDELIAKGILRSSLVNGQRRNAVILDGKLKGPFELFTQRKPEVLGKDISGLYGSVEAPSNEGNLFFRPTLLEDSNALLRTGEIDRPITYLNIINDPKKLSLIRKAADNGTMLTTPEGIPIVSSVNKGQSVSAGAYAAAIENADKGPFWVVTKGILPHVNDPYVERFYDFFTNSDWNATQYGYFGRRRELISWLKNRGFDENSLQYKNAMERFDVIEALNRAKKVKEWAYPNFAEGTAPHPHRRLGDLVNFSKEHLIKKKGNDINWTDTEKEDYMRSVFGLSLFGGGDLTQGGVKEFLIPRGNYVDIRTNKVVPFDNFGNEIPYYIDFTKTYPKEGTLINYTNFEGKYMPINGMYDLETAAAYKEFPMFRMLRVGDPVPSSSFGLPLRTAIPLKRKGGVVKRN